MRDRLRLLLTGASGFLGRHAAAALTSEYDVHGVVRSPAAACDSVRYHVVDFSAPWEFTDLPDKMDIIVHLAQSSRFRDFPDEALDVFHVNVDSTARLLDYARCVGARWFVYASSGGVYGAGSGAFHENSPIVSNQRLGYYLGSKLCSEVLVQSYAELMDVKILRFFFMYGCGQRRSMLVPRLVDSVRTGLPITLQGSDGLRVNPVHVRDAVDMLRACLRHPGSQTINVSGPDELSIREIAGIIGVHVQKAPRFAAADGPPSDLLGNNALMRSMLRRPLVAFREGVVDAF